ADEPVAGGRVAGGDGHAEDHAADAAHGGDEHRLDEELGADVRLGRPERPPQADLGPALEDGDHHHVGDPDTADEEGDRPQPQKRAVNARLVVARAARASEGRVTLMSLGDLGLAVAASTARTAST